MLTRRKSMTESSQDSQEMDKSKICYAKEGEKRRIFILPEAAAFRPEEKGSARKCGVFEGGPRVVSLRHPRHGDGRLFLLHSQGGELYELKSFASDEPRCWFAGTTLLRDGCMYMVAPVDPLFLALPYLMKATKSGRYKPLDDALEDETYFSISQLSTIVPRSQWLNICTVKTVDDKQFYSACEERILSWLSKKVDLLADKLEKMSVQVGHGSRAAVLATSKSHKTTKEDRLRYACGVVVDLVEVEMGLKLYQHLGIQQGGLGRSDTAPSKRETLSSEEEHGEDQPPALKKMRSDPTGQPMEDYTQYNKKAASTAKATVKKTAAQRSLEKVDKTGMKSIGSFFSASGGGGKKKK